MHRKTISKLKVHKRLLAMFPNTQGANHISLILALALLFSQIKTQELLLPCCERKSHLIQATGGPHRAGKTANFCSLPGFYINSCAKCLLCGLSKQRRLTADKRNRALAVLSVSRHRARTFDTGEQQSSVK